MEGRGDQESTISNNMLFDLMFRTEIILVRRTRRAPSPRTCSLTKVVLNKMCSTKTQRGTSPAFPHRKIFMERLSNNVVWKENLSAHEDAHEIIPKI
jgi:hypothetical protein